MEQKYLSFCGLGGGDKKRTFPVMTYSFSAIPCCSIISGDCVVTGLHVVFQFFSFFYFGGSKLKLFKG